MKFNLVFILMFCLFIGKNISDKVLVQLEGGKGVKQNNNISYFIFDEPEVF